MNDPLAVSSEPGFDWPCFLGPDHNGVSKETGLLETWPAEGPPLVWSKKVGEGHGAPSVLGQRLVLHHYEQRKEVVECFHALTGESLWTHKYPSSFRDPYGYNNGPRCSPILTPQYCYTFGAEGVLLCLNLATGEVVWKRETQQDFTVRPSSSTVQAPQLPVPHPMCVPVRRSSSRSISASLARVSTAS